MATTTIDNWRRRGLGDGELTPRQMVIYRLIKHKGPIFTVQVILELCKGPAIDPTRKRGIENDLKWLHRAGYLCYDFVLHQWRISCGKIPQGA